jgi:hypothetical protein
MKKIVLRQTMRAEMRPNCYGGKTCDKIVPRWNCYADGDKQDDNLTGAIKLDPRSFPPGATVVISEPICPKCGETRSHKFPPTKRGPRFEPKCDCGFDWEAWTLGEYS